VGRKRVLDSTALYDAVATQDTVTLIRSAVRGLLKVVDPNVKVQGASPPRAGLYSQDDFTIDTSEGTVCCPQGVLVVLKRSKDGSAVAEFGEHCKDCPVRVRCTTSRCWPPR
jgi:hypothetical protein